MAKAKTGFKGSSVLHCVLPCHLKQLGSVILTGAVCQAFVVFCLPRREEG